MKDRDSRLGDLLRRANRGDRTAYSTFLEEVTPLIRTVVRARSINREGQEDIVQEALMAVHTKRHTWRETDPVTPWLYAIARYKAADAFRRNRRRGSHLPIDDMVEGIADEARHDPTVARDLRRLLGAIDERSAQIVRSIAIEGDSAGEVGARLGMTEGAVRVAHHRAMARLRQLASEDTETDEKRA